MKTAKKNEVEKLIEWMAGTDNFKKNGSFEFKVRYGVKRIQRIMANTAEGINGWNYIKTDKYLFMFNEYSKVASLELK